ncbi:YraN family protein [Dietzia sp. 179-F 9C3 NHS]|uniref:YraN family protein n=1 Tax=Dietzia sp. 179-F 9C3 NHS TaxID=3374295 RepID=UPI003879C4B8
MAGDGTTTAWDRRRETGRLGEAYAAELLGARGCEVLDRNWHCPRGELDLVVRDGEGRTRFVEVRTRTGSGFGTPAESVTTEKLRRVRMLAREWLAAHPGGWRQVCFDVVSVDLRDPDRPRLEVFEDVI